MTRKQYNAAREKLQDKLTDIELTLAWWDAEYELGTLAITPELGEEWNRMHDQQRDTEQELAALDREWSRRNWTSQDWYQWELVTSNID